MIFFFFFWGGEVEGVFGSRMLVYERAVWGNGMGNGEKGGAGRGGAIVHIYLCRPLKIVLKSSKVLALIQFFHAFMNFQSTFNFFLQFATTLRL